MVGSGLTPDSGQVQYCLILASQAGDQGLNPLLRRFFKAIILGKPLQIPRNSQAILWMVCRLIPKMPDSGIDAFV